MSTSQLKWTCHLSQDTGVSLSQVKLEWFITLQLHISTPLWPFPVRPASTATGNADNFNKAGRLACGDQNKRAGREGRRSLSLDWALITPSQHNNKQRSQQSFLSEQTGKRSHRITTNKRGERLVRGELSRFSASPSLTAFIVTLWGFFFIFFLHIKSRSVNKHSFSVGSGHVLMNKISFCTIITLWWALDFHISGHITAFYCLCALIMWHREWVQSYLLSKVVHCF